MKVDKITIDVILHSLNAYCEHMATVLTSTAYSPLLYDALDFSTALFNKEGEMLAQNLGCPVHLAAMPATVNAVIKTYEGDIHEGDTFLTNDPYIGGTHLGDFTFITPVYLDGELIGFSASRLHVTDYGSIYPGGDMPAIDIFQEGLRIPPIKIVTKWNIQNDVIRLIVANSRTPTFIEGDIRAAIAANEIGRRSLLSLCKKYGVDVAETSFKEILKYGENSMREGIRKIKPGEYTAEDFIDDDTIEIGKPVKLKVKITVKDDYMIVDWTGSSPLVRGPLNRPKAAAIGDSVYPIKALVDPEGPANSGMFKPIEVIIPENSLLDAKWPYPVGQGNLVTTARMTDVIWQALAPALPHQVIGMSYGGCDQFQAFGIDPETGKSWTLVDLPAGGWGGRYNKDGLNATWHLLGNCQDTPVEIIEKFYPVRVLQRGLRVNSGGYGKYRGGLGSINVYQILTPASISVAVNRAKGGPPGVFGGLPGKPGKIRVKYPDGRGEILCGVDEERGEYVGWNKVIEYAPSGTVIIIESAGGGGYGDYRDRDLRSIMDDVIDGYYTLDEIEKIYGKEVITKLRIEISQTNFEKYHLT
ncbi:MAG: hydantoinase B/oxoprolinase family protein [Ignisphaera sp.]